MTGIFDSGLGGLTVLRPLLNMAPQGDYIYLADTSRVPYGGRARDELINIARSDVEFLISKGADVIAAGCGTASSVLPKEYTDKLPVPFYGTFDAAVKTAGRAGCKVAFLATSASVKSGVFEKKLREENPDTDFVGVECPDFVPLIEGGIKENRAGIHAAAKKYAAQAQGAGAIVLGCTHFPLVADIISEYTSASIIDIGMELARAIAPSEKGGGTLRIFVSGDRAQFVKNASAILGFDLGPVTEGFTWKDYEQQIHDND